MNSVARVMKTWPSRRSLFAAGTLLLMLCCGVHVSGTDAGAAQAACTNCIDVFEHDMLMAVGDSLTHGTMNGTNNETNTRNAYLQQIYESLSAVAGISFFQPYLDITESRKNPFAIPTNLGVDGSDIFSAEGVEYYKRGGAEFSYTTRAYLCDRLLPGRFSDLYDSVLYPLNIVEKKAVSQIDAAVRLLQSAAGTDNATRAVFVFWMGNNDSSNATLGMGTRNPAFIPLPFDLIAPHLKPMARQLMSWGEQAGVLSFTPYTLENITRNLTEPVDFQKQYDRVVNRLLSDVSSFDDRADLFLCTLPYYSSVGYLFDAEDIEFYLQQINPGYSVPTSFSRGAQGDGVPLNGIQGDRVPLFTFLCMYALLSEGASVDMVNCALETDGVQRDGLVLSAAEQQYIRTRINSFNTSIKESDALSHRSVHLVNTGQYINDILGGRETVVINGTTFTRRWGRGGSFCLDGVHPGYTAQAVIANYILERINSVCGYGAPEADLADVYKNDPYIDRDGDGWVPGPGYEAPGIPSVLLLFADPDDTDPAAVPVLPDNVWDSISEILLEEFLL